MDMSEYIIDAFREKWGNGTFEQGVDEDGSPVLHVHLIGIVEFSIDLKAAEHALLELNIDPEAYVESIIESAKVASIFEDEDDNLDDDVDGTFSEIADAMDMIFIALMELNLIDDDAVGDPLESDTQPGMCMGLWINIGIHPVPFYFYDSWKNIIRDKRPVTDYVKMVIIKHVGKIPNV